MVGSLVGRCGMPARQVEKIIPFPDIPQSLVAHSTELTNERTKVTMPIDGPIHFRPSCFSTPQSPDDEAPTFFAQNTTPLIGQLYVHSNKLMCVIA